MMRMMRLYPGNKTWRNRGFTLIELLVVIAIIAILAAILFPVMAQVKAKGASTACANNVKQISVALCLYMLDNGDYFPPGWPKSWAGHCVMQYAKTKRIFQCPIDRRRRPNETEANPRLSYAANYFTFYKGEPISKDNLRFGGNKYRKMSSIMQATRVVSLVEIFYGSATIYSDGINPSFSATLFKDAPGYHLNGDNFAFLDGHVKWFDQTKRAGGKSYFKEAGITLNPGVYF